MANDYYMVLGVDRTANLRRIKCAYRKMAKRYHPDSGQVGSDPARFREVPRAYETLTDTDRRRRYDAELKAQAPPVERRMAGQRRRRPQPPIEPAAEAPVPSFGQVPPEMDFFFEVVLTPAEAAGGGVFTIHLPMAERCPGCGAGRERRFCPVCGGSGLLRLEREIGLSIPPGTRHGTEATLRLVGTDRGRRQVHVRVLVDTEA